MPKQAIKSTEPTPVVSGSNAKNTKPSAQSAQPNQSKSKGAKQAQPQAESTKSKVNQKKVKEVKAESKAEVETKNEVPATEQISSAQVSSSTESSEFKFPQQLELFLKELKMVKDSLGALSSSAKKLDAAYNADIKRAKKTKQKRTKPHVATGFAKEQVVPKELAKFIGVAEGSSLTGPQITKKVWEQLKARNLTYANDKRIFRTDKVVSKIFNVPESVNTSTNHKDKAGFNFCNLQTFIANALK